MKEIMLITLGVAAGFAVCGFFWLYVMSRLTKNAKTRNDEHMATTERLLRERNQVNWAIEKHLGKIVDHLTADKQPAKKKS